MPIIPPTVIGSQISPTVIGTTISPTVIGTTIAPTVIGSSVAPTVIGTTITPTTIGTTIAPTVISGSDTSRQQLTPEQIQEQDDWSLVQHLDAEVDRLEAQDSHQRPGDVEYLNPAHISLNSGGGSGGGGGSPPVYGTSALQERPRWRPRVLEGGRGAPANPVAQRSSRYREIQDAWNRSPANRYPFEGRAPVLRPKTINPIAADAQPIARNAAGRGGQSAAVREAIERFEAASKVAADRAAANRAALSAPPGVRMPTSLRPMGVPSTPAWNPAAIARGALPWLSRGLRIFGRVPFLPDLLFPEPTGNLDQSPYAGTRNRLGNPNFKPSGQSPGGTPAPPRPNDPPTPGTYKPPGSRAQLYKISFSGYRADFSKTNPAWIGSTIEQQIPPFIFDYWGDQVSGEIEFMGPLTFEYRAPDPAAVANYVQAPSGYDRVHVANPQTGNKLLILAATGYFAQLTSLQITAPGGLPELWEIPPKFPPPIPQPPVVPQPPIRDPSFPVGPDPSRPNLPEVQPPNQPGPIPGLPPIPGRPPAKAPGRNPTRDPGRRPNLDPKTPTPPRPNSPPIAPPARAPNIKPPRWPIPGTGKRPGPGRPPCLPKPQLEPQTLTCKFNPAELAALQTILTRLGNPGDVPNGIAGALATNPDSIQKTLGPPIKNRTNKAVGVTDYLKGMRGKQVLLQAMNFLNVFLLLHNAAMLSRNLVESVGDLMSMGLQAARNVFTGGQAADDDPIDINELVGQGFQGLMTDIFGKTQWQQIQAKWISFNRIITSAANVAYTIQGLFDGARNIIEITSTNVARIGNALKNSRVVNQNGYGFMNPNINSATGRFAKLQDLLNNSAEVADIGTTIAGETINISEEGKELADNLKRFNENVQEGTNRYNEKGELIDKDGKLIRPGDAQGTALAESARRVSQGSEISILDLLKGEKNPE